MKFRILKESTLKNIQIYAKNKKKVNQKNQVKNFKEGKKNQKEQEEEVKIKKG